MSTLELTPSSAGRSVPTAVMASARSTATVEVVIPVYNEQAALPVCLRRLHEHLSCEFPFAWTVTVVDNASTDQTVAVARAMADDLPGVEVLSLPEKGRGRALRAAWSRSTADVVAYMDVDLSTDLRALLPLIAPLVSGHSDLAIGSRLAQGARVTRGPKREFISRTYNLLLKASLQARFSDAQCGFKAARGDVIRRLLPDVEDEAWFFDTELLVLAQRRGLRVHEVPVDWTDDPDSRVDILRTARDDLRGIARMLATSPVARFAAVGVLSTLAYAVIYLLLRGGIGAAAANAVALALTALANTQANRSFTFGLRGSAGLVRQHLAGALVFLLALGLTSAALDLQRALWPSAPAALELAVLIATSACATVTRYVTLKAWVFARRTGDRPLQRLTA